MDWRPSSTYHVIQFVIELLFIRVVRLVRHTAVHFPPLFDVLVHHQTIAPALSLARVIQIVRAQKQRLPLQ